ncbi:MAG: type IV pilus biogenesis/stability protein PilW [Rhodospirillaceae bacterium]|nr:type IV pilus biogenesis/stability protein PilW [Rhodospirillaceae bacterium]MDD9998031.1 type IV pilus biogenesis/stability protein PilW [Rhodospirillaceae bacterium]MDE0359807.1 type IV pilus biogenesis/stability protein PilW [Rhodospirillaceae bacterium]
MRFLNRYLLPPLGMLLLCQGCVSTSATSASSTATSGGAAAVANLNLGAAYLRQGRLTLALERLDRALDHDPRLAEAHSTIATVYDRLGDVDEARDHHRRAIRLAPNDPAAANSFGVFLCRHERWNDAEPLFLRAADNPRYHTPEVALTNAGICARNAGDGAKAERYLRDALARNPIYADGLFNLAALAFANSELDEARRFLGRHSESAPDSAQAAWLCFQVETGLGNRNHAGRCASMLREQFPESPESAQLELLDNGGRP